MKSVITPNGFTQNKNTPRRDTGDGRRKAFKTKQKDKQRAKLV